MSERYANKRKMFRRGGRFTKPPTLEQMGVEVADICDRRKCGNCGHEWRPLLAQCVCPLCLTPSVERLT